MFYLYADCTGIFMSVNNVGLNMGTSSLLASYLENKRVAASASKNSKGAQGAMLRAADTQKPATQNPIRQTSLPHNRITQNQTLQNTLQNTQAVKNSAMQPDTLQADTLVKSKDENTKDSSIVSKAKDFFKKPKTKKVLTKALKAAILIAFIAAITIVSPRRKPTSETLYEPDESIDELILTLSEVLTE